MSVRQLRQHSLQDRHRQSHDIRLGAGCELQPVRAVLQTKAAGFPFPKAGRQVLIEFLIRQRSHQQFRVIDLDQRFSFLRPDAHSAVNAMLCPGERGQHSSRVFFIGRFAQDRSLMFGHRIASDDRPACLMFASDPLGNVGRFLERQPRHQHRRGLAAAQPTLGRFAGRNHLGFVARITEQFTSPGRTAGQDDAANWWSVHDELLGKVDERALFRESITVMDPWQFVAAVPIIGCKSRWRYGWSLKRSTARSSSRKSLSAMPDDLQILYEDNHLLAINKPAEIATMGAAAGQPSMHTRAQQDLKRRYNKPGNVYLGVVSRLDAFVSGVLLFAKTSKAAARLSAQFAAGAPEKIYLAAVEGHVDDEAAGGEYADQQEHILEDWLRKNEPEHRMEIAPGESANAKLARLAWRSLQQAHGKTLLQIRLLTGRKHQIRVQWSALGHAIVGDTKYGGKKHRQPGIALHAASLTVEHPTRKEPVTITAPVPDWWSTLGFDGALLRGEG